MRITLIRTDKQNVTHVSTRTLENFLERIKTDTTKESVAAMRRELPFLITYGGKFKDLHQLPRVYPAAELSKDEGGDPLFHRWNGLVLLTIGPLADHAAVEKAKQLAMGMPATLAAFAGSSGRTAKLLVRIVPANGHMPETEEEADHLYRAGYQYATMAYGGLFAGTIVKQEPTVRTSFRMTLDPQPLLNTKATPLMVEAAMLASTLSTPVSPPSALTSVHSTTKQRQTDYDKYQNYEFLYRRACNEVAAEMEGRYDDDPHREELFITETARRLRQLSFPEEEAVLHLRSHLWTRHEDQYIRTIVASVYAEEPKKTDKNTDPAIRIRKSQQDVIDLLERRYAFRFNTVMGYTEYRPNNTWVADYQPVDERVQNQMAIECRLAGIDAWPNDISRYLRSTFVPSYNPVNEYLGKCYGKWDGRDRIRELARTVPTANELWPDWFYTWFLGMVRQWRSTIFDRYGNQVAPLLISTQGWNKSSFILSLLPPELQWGYTDQLQVSEKRTTLQAMSQFLLINLEEFNQISPQLQQGFLKNIISLPTVKVKRPYGKHVEQFPRLASFIGATNQTDVLCDPSGARRFLGIELTGPIDISRRPNHEQLFAQAMAALDAGERCYFDERQTAEIMASNRRFQQLSPAEQWFHDLFEPAANEQEGQYLSATAIFAHIKKQAGSDLRAGSLNHFGRVLANIDGMQRKRTTAGSLYLVKYLKK